MTFTRVIVLPLVAVLIGLGFSMALAYVVSSFSIWPAIMIPDVAAWSYDACWATLGPLSWIIISVAMYLVSLIWTVDTHSRW